MKICKKQYMEQNIDDANDDLLESIEKLEDVRGTLNQWFDTEDDANEILEIINKLNNKNEKIESKIHKQGREEQEEQKREYYKSVRIL